MDSNYDNEDIDTTLESEDNEPQRDSRQFVRDLERKAKEGQAAKREADAAKAEAAAAKRELALMKAGIDISSGAGKLFAKAYDGEASVEAIKSAAAEYGLIPTSEQAEVKSDLQAFDRVSNASVGTPGAPTESDLDKIRNSKDPSEVLDIIRKAGIEISNEQPGGFIPIPGLIQPRN